MPVVSPSRYSTTSSSTLSTGTYRSPLSSSSSLDRPYYRGSGGTYVSSSVRTSYGDHTTEYRSRYSDVDGRRDRNTSITEYRSSRAPSVTESESGISRYRSDRSESRAREPSATRDSSARGDMPRNPAGTLARRNVATTALLASSAADLYNKYSPANYVPLTQRLSSSTANQNSFEIGRSKSISSDIGRPPAADSRTSRRARNPVAVPTVSEHRTLTKRSSSYGYKEHSPSPSFSRKPNAKDTNGNDVQPSVSEIRKRFDQKMTVTKLPANDPRYAKPVDSFINQLKNSNGATNFTKEKPVPVHLPADKRFVRSRSNSDASISKTMSETQPLAAPSQKVYKNNMATSFNGRLTSDRVLAVKSQLDPNNPIGKILEKSTVIKVEAPKYENVTSIEVKDPKVKHTSNFASYIQISRPIASAMESPGSKSNGSESPKLNGYVNGDARIVKDTHRESPSRTSDHKAEDDMKIAVEAPKRIVQLVDEERLDVAKPEDDVPKRPEQSGTDDASKESKEQNKQSSEEPLKFIDDDRLILNDIDSPSMESGFENKTFEHENFIQRREGERRVEEEEKKMETSSESTASDLTEDSSQEMLRQDEEKAELAGGKARRTPDRELTVNGTSNRVKKAAAGLRGLRNIGNTCFMNSVLQCLSNTKPLVEYVQSAQYRRDINTTLSSMQGGLIKAFATVICELWKEDEADCAVNTTALKSQVQKFAPRFMGYSQQDAQEFLRYLLEGLHEDINRVTVKPKPILTEIDDSLSDSAKAAEAWSRYMRMEESKVGDIFIGQLKSTLRCTHCQHDSVTFDPFWDLSLPIPSRTGNLKIQQCLSHFTREEEMDGDEKPTCSKCGVRRKCLKWFTVNRFPRVLVLHLKRFSPTERFRGKLNVLVEFPLANLDMSPYAANKGQEATYTLYAVSNHSGTTYSGHYTAYCKHPYTGDWYEYNDSRVSPISQRSVVSSEAYVLFYELTSKASS